MILNNFLYRVGQYAKENRARLIKWALILAAVIVGALLIYYGVERFHARRFEKRVEALDKRYEKAEAEAKAAEALINALKVELRAKDALLEELDKQAAAAQKVVERTRTVYVSLKDEYEKTRDNPLPAADVSCDDVCAKLAALGRPCQ